LLHDLIDLLVVELAISADLETNRQALVILGDSLSSIEIKELYLVDRFDRLDCLDIRSVWLVSRYQEAHISSDELVVYRLIVGRATTFWKR
jgi:hypothetical protein